MKWKYPTDTPTYNSWRAMRNRVLYQNNPNYKDVTICPEWESYTTFYEDMGERPNGKTLDRINEAKLYSKETCCWSDWIEQNNNKSSNLKVTFKGHTQTLSEWKRRLGWTKKRIQ